MKYQKYFTYALVVGVVMLLPQLGLCDVVGSLNTIQAKLVNQILPLVSILGLIFAGFSFISGNPAARTHLTLALLGTAIAFGAESIMRFIQSMVH